MSNNFFHKEQYLRSIGIKCGKGCRVHSTVIISNPKNLILGSNVRIDAFTTILSVKKIHIKNYIHVGPYVVLHSGGGEIKLENFCGISAGVKIYTHVDDYTGKEFVADRSQLEKDVATRGAALSYGPDSYQEFMSPYQREVIDATTAALDRQQQQGIAALRQRAQQAGAFGGGREAAMLGEYQAVGDIQRALAEAQLLQQGFQQAQAGALGNLQAQQGLGQYQASLGGQERGIDQAQLTADAQEAREMQLEPFTRLGLVTPQLASVIGGFPAQTIQTTTPPPSFGQQALGLGIGAAGLAGAAKKFGLA